MYSIQLNNMGLCRTKFDIRPYSIKLRYGQESLLDQILNSYYFFQMAWPRVYDKKYSKFECIQFEKWLGEEFMLDQIRNSNLFSSMAWPRVYTRTNSKFEGISFSENFMAKGLFSTKFDIRIYCF